MKSLLRALALLAASSSLSSAASIAFAAAADVDIRTSTLEQLGTSFTARVGVLAPGTVLTPASNFAQINAAFTTAGQTAFASGALAGFNGYFAGNASFNDPAGFAGKDVFIWITDGANQNLVLRSTNIDFLSDSSIPNANSIDIAAAFVNNFEVLLGSYNSGGPNAANGGSFVLAVPEPSAMLLGLLGAVGLIRRRR